MLCVDASVVIRFVVTRDPGCIALWSQWERERQDLIAPLLLRYEFMNAIYRYVRAGIIERASADQAHEVLLGLPIRMLTEPRLHGSALQIAQNLRLPAAYDAHYLAAAMSAGVEFWTADERLYNASRHHYDWVRLTPA